MEDLRKAVHALLEQRLERLGRHVAAGEAGAAGGDDDVDVPDRRSSASPTARIASIVVGDDRRARRARGPASAMRAASVSPDLSSASVRVSETVSTAMRTGMKERFGSMSVASAFTLAALAATALAIEELR